MSVVFPVVKQILLPHFSILIVFNILLVCVLLYGERKLKNELKLIDLYVSKEKESALKN